MDSGATDHVTCNLSQLSISKNYEGEDKLQVGNGEYLLISHTGHSFIPSNLHSKCLYLKNILCVPKITKNLLSISKFTRDNNVVVEFDANSCVIKDKSTKAMLLQGGLKEGLYQLEIPTNTTDLFKPCVSSYQCDLTTAYTSPNLAATAHFMSPSTKDSSQCFHKPVTNNQHLELVGKVNKNSDVVSNVSYNKGSVSEVQCNGFCSRNESKCISVEPNVCPTVTTNEIHNDEFLFEPTASMVENNTVTASMSENNTANCYVNEKLSTYCLVSEQLSAVNCPVHEQLSVEIFYTTVSIANCLTVDKHSHQHMIWHKRLGHPNSTKLHKILSTLPKSVSLTENQSLPIKVSNFCDACQLGKLHQNSFPLSQSHATEPLALIHSDVWGPAPVTSVEGFRYYVQFLDDFSRFTWLFPLRTKAEVKSTFIKFHHLAERQFGTKLKCLQSDQGAVVTSVKFNENEFPYSQEFDKSSVQSNFDPSANSTNACSNNTSPLPYIIFQHNPFSAASDPQVVTGSQTVLNNPAVGTNSTVAGKLSSNLSDSSLPSISKIADNSSHNPLINSHEVTKDRSESFPSNSNSHNLVSSLPVISSSNNLPNFHIEVDLDSTTPACDPAYSCKLPDLNPLSKTHSGSPHTDL
ncbi:uncharacterized protein LOC116118873 [Pistacia vera]|uniref:uncharacterized protein LOC116118873 n=1 Tax=Pistacia vera TaxID=55513 RepID=UPI0012638D3C|nr:uncharacterized protein LOC116118873 [Pistacia vera]